MCIFLTSPMSSTYPVLTLRYKYYPQHRVIKHNPMSTFYLVGGDEVSNLHKTWTKL